MGLSRARLLGLPSPRGEPMAWSQHCSTQENLYQEGQPGRSWAPGCLLPLWAFKKLPAHRPAGQIHKAA